VVTVEELRLQGWHVPDAAVAAGLAEVSWPARMEVIGRRPLVVLDCAHNVASALAVVETLRSSFQPGRLLPVFAGSSDKDLAGMFRVMAPHFSHAWLTRYTDNPRWVARSSSHHCGRPRATPRTRRVRRRSTRGDRRARRRGRMI
jgi:dihydrofolate synthase/folylpolyglutamate synthase